MGRPSKRHRTYTPRDAERILKDPYTAKKATDLIMNSIHRGCDARTRGADARRQVDLYREKTHEHLQWELASLLELPIGDFRQQVPVLREATIRPGQPFRNEDRDGKLFVEEWMGSKKPRIIAIPTPWADCTYRAFDEALQKTSNHLIPTTARAYRRGQSDAVHGVLWEASIAIRQGARYWAVLDIKSFFPSMDHGHLKKTLEGLGYTPWFVERVMALIQGTVLQENGKTRTNTKGCPPGLRISGTLANLYLRELDLLIEKTFGARVLYRRYSDDITVVAQKRHEVVGAVKSIKRWLKNRGLGVKAAWVRMPSEHLVHSIEKHPLDVLGARVLKTGEIVMQPKKAEAFKARFIQRAKLAQQLGPIIAGVSQYAEWKAPKGCHAYDTDDLRDMLDQVEQYWGLLNGPVAKEFSADLRRESGADLPLRGRELSQTWTAWIPGRKRHLVGGANRVRQVSAGQLLETLTQLVLHLPPRPLPGPSGLVGDLISSHVDEEQLVQTLPLRPPSGPSGLVADRLCSSFCGWDHSTSSTGGGEHDLHWDHGRKPGCTCGCRGEVEMDQNPSATEGKYDDTYCCTDTSGSSSSRLVPGPLKDQWKEREEKDQKDLVQISMEVDQVGFGRAQAGAVGSSPPSASPLVVEVTIEDEDRKGAPLTHVAVLRLHGTVKDTYQLPAQSTLVEALRAELARAQAAGVRVLVVRVPAWLPKALLKATARFHGVALFDRVLKLHREVAAGDTDLVLFGVPDQSGFGSVPEQAAT